MSQSIDARYDAIRSLPKIDAPAGNHFGRDPDGYDLGQTVSDDPMEAAEDPLADGAPGRELVRGVALAWARLWGRFDPETAGIAFHMEPRLVREVMPTPDQYQDGPQQTDRTDRLVQMVSFWREDCTVADVCALTNLTPDQVRDTVKDHPWMGLSGDPENLPAMTIWHDGE